MLHRIYAENDVEDVDDYMVLNGDFICGHLRIIFEGIFATIHLQVYKWSRRIGFEMLQDWKEALKILRERGCKHVVVTYDDDDKVEHWKRFIALFGFPPPHKVYISKLEI